MPFFYVIELAKLIIIINVLFRNPIELIFSKYMTKFCKLNMNHNRSKMILIVCCWTKSAMIIAGFDEFHQFTTLSVEYLPKMMIQVNLTEKVKKKINLFAIFNSLPFPELNLFQIGFTKKRYKTSNSVRRKRKCKIFFNRFLDRGLIFSRSSVGHLKNKFILPFWSVEDHT